MSSNKERFLCPGPNQALKLSRREALLRSAGGFGGLALAWLGQQGQAKASIKTASGLEPRSPHFAAKVKSVIVIFQAGGPSQMDLFDPKPALKKYDGQDIPIKINQRNLSGKTKLLASPYEFKPRGQSGIEVSELLPGLAEVVDEITLLRGCVTDRIDHDTAQLMFASGRNTSGFPSMGSWVTYGLGTENQDLPAFVAIVPKLSSIGSRAWTSAWLPPIHQGTTMSPQGTPMFDLSRPDNVTEPQQQHFLRALNGLNRMHQESRRNELELEARIANYELAARMQLSAMRQTDFSNESAETKRSYGLGSDETREYGMGCLLARRLVESGVRFVEIINSDWDHHGQIFEKLPKACIQTDRPVAALIKDLKQRGLLESTLVVWGSEFGRLPVVEGRDGRDHNPHGFTLWLAGGGLKPGFVYGATDEFGYAATEGRVTHSDVHATILHQLGLDFQKLTYDHEGRAETLTGVNPARVITEILA